MITSKRLVDFFMSPLYSAIVIGSSDRNNSDVGSSVRGGLSDGAEKSGGAGQSKRQQRSHEIAFGQSRVAERDYRRPGRSASASREVSFGERDQGERYPAKRRVR